MKSVLVVFNYNAGRKKAVLYKKVIHKYLIQNSQKFRFISIDELSEISLDEFDTIFAVGGDGTVNKTAKIAVNSKKNLAIIPTGTANLLSAKLSIPQNLNKALKIIDKNNLKKIDTLDINGNFCVLRCGIGYDSDIICKTPQSLKNKFGYFSYFISGIIFALRLSSKRYKINYDGNVKDLDASCIITANADNMFRNLVSVSNNSKLNDGFFEVFALKTTNPICFFFEFVKILIGIKKSGKYAEYFQCKHLTIKNDYTSCHIDGEKTKLKYDIVINIIPKTLNIYN